MRLWGLLISDDHLLSGYLDGLSSNKVNHPNNSSDSLHKNSTDARIHSKVLVIVDTSSIILSSESCLFLTQLSRLGLSVCCQVEEARSRTLEQLCSSRLHTTTLGKDFCFHTGSRLHVRLYKALLSSTGSSPSACMGCRNYSSNII